MTLCRKFFLKAKEPDLRSEVNSDEPGSLEPQYPLGIWHRERAGAPAETPLEICPSLSAHPHSPRMSRVGRDLQLVPPCAWLSCSPRREQNFCHMVTMNSFLPRQTQSSSPPISTLHPGHAAGLCGGWRAQQLLICYFWVCYADMICAATQMPESWAGTPRQLLFPIW